MKKTFTLTLIAFTLISCVSNRVFNDLESRYAQIKDNNNRKTKTIGMLNEELNEINENYKIQIKNLSYTRDSLRSKKQEIEKQKSSLRLLKENSESSLKARIKENEELMDKIADRENELADRISRVEELEGLIALQKKMVSSLKEKLSNALLNFEDKGLTVEAQNGKVYISMENKLLFRSGSWNVEPQGQRAILKFSEILADNPDISILIEGHTDDIPYSGRGPLENNWDLSTKRATSIVKILLENPDILPQNLTAAGRGEYLPIETNSSIEGRAANRRIEVILSPRIDEITQIINTLD